MNIIRTEGNEGNQGFVTGLRYSLLSSVGELQGVSVKRQHNGV
jgi:hypothetical protein